MKGKQKRVQFPSALCLLPLYFVGLEAIDNFPWFDMKRRDILMASSGLATTMLFAKTAHPTAAQTARGEMVTLATDLQGYYVRPLTRNVVPAVLVFMEAYGVNDYIKSVCDRLAQAGYAALAPDFYHGDVFAYTDREAAIAKLRSLDETVAMQEVGSAIDYLAQRGDVLPGAVGAIGFCLGGRFAFMANEVHADKLKAAVAYYGGGIAPAEDALGRPSLLPQVPQMQAPIMLMYGANDQMIAPDEHARIAEALSTAKKRYAINVFPDAGHAFFSDRRENYNAAAAEEAWQMTLNFLQFHLT